MASAGPGFLLDNDGERTQERGIQGLKVQNTKGPGVDLEQPEGILFLLQKQAAEKSCAGVALIKGGVVQLGVFVE